MVDGEPASEEERREAARYIQELAKELKVMADTSRLGFLAYLLAMVENEASHVAAEKAKAQTSAKEEG